MKDCVLITGGAGFIGTTISKLLPAQRLPVVVMDNMHPQVHSSPERPARLHADAVLVRGDVTDRNDWHTLLSEWRPRTIFHLAAETGTGQSLTEANRHGMVNVVGTTQMLDALSARGIVPEKFVLTSSRAVYGEGRWKGREGEIVYPGQRTAKMLGEAQWDFPAATSMPSEASETMPMPTSVYGATKLAQEHVLSSWCNSFGAPLTTLRLQNVYGVGQSLTNSYTGIVSLFCRMAKAGKSIPVYEDGNIIRDFVYIDDVARAVVKAAQPGSADGEVLDVGTGIGTSISELAAKISELYGAPEPHVTGAFRNGDVRSAHTTIDRTSSLLHWKPTVSLSDGIERLSRWIDEEDLSGAF